ncbi:MAG TPA: formyltetrahydrofolate deformylase [Burkholderiaceae bacterium]|nr:formyltetrahydrofolate deformylase [Burkholderiaceae bacterium]
MNDRAPTAAPDASVSLSGRRPQREFVLTLSCPDAKGIVYAVSGLLFQAGCNIIDSQQFGDVQSEDGTGLFFMRVHFEAPEHLASIQTLDTLFRSVRDQFRMQATFHSLAAPTRVLLLVSKQGHCLNDLLFRWKTGNLGGPQGVEVSAIVSNHPDFADLAASYGLPFHHLPLGADTKAGASVEAKRAQEQRIEALMAEHRVELVVLARYMQILSPEFCATLAGRAINIHHSFLPSFKGARPYAQAHARGVKMIGATAHYVTGDLDEGPIIEQDVERVDHSLSPEDLAAIGRDVECRVLARAVRWHTEHRVLLNGQRTIIFR